jgi:hypothetical protein
MGSHRRLRCRARVRWLRGGIVFALIDSKPGVGLAGAVFLIGLLYSETRSSSPMLPLGLFRSTSFSGANLLTLFLYSA